MRINNRSPNSGQQNRRKWQQHPTLLLYSIDYSLLAAAVLPAAATRTDFASTQASYIWTLLTTKNPTAEMTVSTALIAALITMGTATLLGRVKTDSKLDKTAAMILISVGAPATLYLSMHEAWAHLLAIYLTGYVATAPFITGPQAWIVATATAFLVTTLGTLLWLG